MGLQTAYGLLRRIKPLRALVRAVRGLVRRWRVDAWVLTGQERTSAHRLVVLISGQLENKNYLRRVLFRQPVEEVYAKMWRWQLDRAASNAAQDFDLSVIDTTDTVPGPMNDQTKFWIPNWVQMELDLAESAEREQTSRDVKNDLRRVRQQGFEFDVSSRFDDLADFFHSMHLPYVRQTFGDETMAMRYEDFVRGLTDQWLLTRVKRDGVVVAADVILYADGVPTAWLLGIRNGDRQLVKDGALAALYYFRNVLLRERGEERLCLGGTRPFLSDGVLRFKRKWGAKISSAHEHERRWFMLEVLRVTPAVRAFLRQNPFVGEDSLGLFGVTFLDEAPSGALDVHTHACAELSALGLARIVSVTLTSRQSDHGPKVAAVQRASTAV